MTAKGTSSTRRSPADVEALKNALFSVTSEIKPASVRQIYYQLVARGLVDKTEREYRGTVCRLLSVMRRSGELPYGWITDNTRFMRKPKTHSSLASMLNEQAIMYRRSLWQDQPLRTLIHRAFAILWTWYTVLYAAVVLA